MLNHFFFFFCLSFLITWPTHFTSCNPINYHRRRFFHQPFYPLDSLPPTEPPSPSPSRPSPSRPSPSRPKPKHPFSDSPSPPSNSPFFPSFPAPPPPPPPPSSATFASFPANISSLILPRTPSPKPASHKLVIAAITAVASAAFVLAIIGFLYIRRRNYCNFSDDKTSRSGNSHLLFHANAETSNGTTTTTTHKLRSSSTSSEFLYLGTLVSSRRIDDQPDSRGNSAGNSGLDTRKLNSPELHPLPPLARQSSGFNCGNGDMGSINCGNREVGSSAEDEEEFYSPRESLGGCDGSSWTGSGSRRVMETMVGESFGEGRRSSASSLGSYSSSISGSPNRSHSISLSPPVNLSPRRPETKSPDSSVFQSPQSLPQQYVAISLVDQRFCSESSSKKRVLENIPAETPRISNASNPNVRSPSLSAMSTSPDRDMERHSGTLDQNLRSPSLYSLSLSPEKGLEQNPDALLPESVGSDRNERASSLSSLSLSTERGLESNPDTSPKISVDLDGNGGSSLVSTPSSSPDRGLGKSPDASSKLSVGLDRNGRSTSNSSLSSSPERGLERNPDASLRLWIASDQSKHSASPSLSSSSLPERVMGTVVRSPKSSNYSDEEQTVSPLRCAFAKTSDVSPRYSNAFDRVSFELNPNRQYSSLSSPSSSDSEHNSDMSPRRFNAESPVIMGSDLRQPLSVPILQQPPPSPPPLPPTRPRKHWKVPCSTPVGHSSLPESDSQHNSDAAPLKSNVLNQNVKSRARKHWEISCPTSALGQSSSSECDSGRSSEASPRTSDVSDQNVESTVRTDSDLIKPISVPPSPPPPPPPPPPLFPLSSRSRKHWEISSPSTPVGQPISRPPALVPPSRPFVIQNRSKVPVSPVELPPISEVMENIDEAPKLKLKPLHWDKVRSSTDREMVWDQLRSSSFKLNEEMIETLFVFNNPNSKPKETSPRSDLPSPHTDYRVLDPKKSQNIAILLRALNVTIEEVCEALLEGNADALGSELLESLLKMAPTKEEELKLKEYKDDSPVKLGPAEKFLKAVLDVPFAFRRVDVMFYIANFDCELEYLRKSLETLEAACEELRNSRMFLKLLEAVLKTGNRMNVGTNRGDAHAFKLDTLLKLADVKGADGKTTLLHFVVQEIIRTEGARLSGVNQAPSSTLSEDVKCRKLGLQDVSGLCSALTNVKKAAGMDSNTLSNDVSKLSRGLRNIEEVVKLNKALESDENSKKFSESTKKFMKMAEEEIIRIQAQESVAMSLVKEITEYFHGNSAKEEAHPFRIFMVVRDFLTVLERVCKEVGMINERTIVSSAHKFPVPINPTLPQVLLPPAFHGKNQYNSSNDESP